MATIVGILLGLGLIGYSIFADGGYTIFLNPIALMIVLGGTIAATLISYPFDITLKFFRLALHLFRFKQKTRYEETVKRLITIGFKASENSVAALEEDLQTEKNPHITLGIRFLMQGTDPDTVVQRYAVEIASVQARHDKGIQLFGFMAKVAPSFGLVGTLIGLINMLRGIGETVSPETLGPAMAVALVTTLYGAILAFLFFLPAAEKLKTYSQDEVMLIGVIRDGILMIQAGEQGRDLEDMLNAYLAPKNRESIMDELMLQKSTAK